MLTDVVAVGKKRVRLEPGESSSPMFGGNSNWRGPIWFPVNHLLIESLQTFADYGGDKNRVVGYAWVLASGPVRTNSDI